MKVSICRWPVGKRTEEEPKQSSKTPLGTSKAGKGVESPSLSSVPAMSESNLKFKIQTAHISSPPEKKYLLTFTPGTNATPGQALHEQNDTVPTKEIRE